MEKRKNATEGKNFGIEYLKNMLMYKLLVK